MRLHFPIIPCAVFVGLLGLTGCSGNTTGRSPSEKTTRETLPATKPTEKAKPTEPIKVTADELTKAYMEDEKAAKAKYPSEAVYEITGIVEQTMPIEKAGTDVSTITLQCHGAQKGALSKMPVYCSFGKDKDSASNKVVAKLKRGDKVTVKGTLQGVVPQAVTLNDCQFIDPKP